MRCEIVAVGTELLLGQIVDTNSSWIGEHLALAGIDCLRHTAVGDNRERMRVAFTEALDRSDAVIVTGGLGPTQDDLNAAGGNSDDCLYHTHDYSGRRYSELTDINADNVGQ